MSILGTEKNECVCVCESVSLYVDCYESWAVNFVYWHDTKQQKYAHNLNEKDAK